MDNIMEVNIACNEFRKAIKKSATSVKFLCDKIKSDTEHNDRDKPEMIANLMLTYRHLEDASMRLGKVIQAYDGGVSVYDKESTVGA